MDKRCDGAFDCQDRSDEDDCSILRLDLASYGGHLPPKNDTGNKTTVWVSIFIYMIKDIEELHMQYTSKIGLYMKWYDNRLTYTNLKDALHNIVSDEYKGKLWVPPLYFSNTDENIQVNTNARTVLEVERQGPYSVTSSYEVHEAELFEGSQNAITSYNEYALQLHCSFNLAWYPFDTQNCKISVSLIWYREKLNRVQLN